MLLSLLVSLPVLMCPVAMYVTLEPKPKCYGTGSGAYDQERESADSTRFEPIRA
jgi:hypothetical protein